MDRRKQADHRARAGREMLKIAASSASATRIQQRLNRLYKERDYLEIKLTRLTEDVPCDLIGMARVLREIAAVEEEIIDQKKRTGLVC